MAVRIYALAKELDIDSKELVDVCTRAGVPGKGSALASLDDDEVAKVKSFLSGGDKKPAAKAAAGPPPVERPKDTARKDRLKVIVTPKAKGPTLGRKTKEQEAAEAEQDTTAQEAADSAAEETAETAAPLEPASDTPDVTDAETRGESKAEEAAEGPTAKAPAESKENESSRSDLSKPGPLAGMVRKEDYIGPGSKSGKMPVVGSGKGGSKKKQDAPKARPVIKLAAMPATAQPAKPAPKKDEAPTQKPDMKLPADVLSGGKLGSKPLAAHLRRAERTLEAEKIRERTEESKKSSRPGSRTSGQPMLGGREQRQLNRSRSTRRGYDASRRFNRRTRKSGINTAAPRKDRVAVQLPCTVRDLSEAAGVPAAQILRILMAEGVMTTITAVMDMELTEFVAAELGLDVDFLQPETLEDKVLAKLEDYEDPEGDLVTRAPVITFLGHVDHGKTSLIDKVIGIDVAAGESGGITQHIRAYQVDNNGRPISVVDTPGHEAFTAMRARGANVTDIAVVVVAADDGVMPQTEEAISHARAADVPIIVALNKIDLPGADINRAMQDLSANDLLPSEWGGDVEVVKTSAATGEGIDDLIETILTVAELQEYEANPKRPAIGTCLEAQQDADQGVVAKVIVETGTLRIGDIIVCGDAYGRVKAMTNPLRPSERLEEAGPSVPVNLIGLDIAPPAGERLYVVEDVADAREIAEDRAHRDRSDHLVGSGFQQVTLETLYDRLDGVEEVQTLNLILRADVRGSIEAIKKELTKLEHPEVRLRILQASVGGVSEADIQLAVASDAVVIAFNVAPDEKARALASERGVEIRRYSIIYKVTDDLKSALEGLLKPLKREVELGRALVQQIYKISRVGVIAGCRVLAGIVERNARARVVRDSTVIADYPIDTLRREKDDAKEVREGYECGIKLSGYNDLKEADIFEVYKVEEISRNFED